jgi:O-antigen/teichoic acid export membrane protein
MRFAFLILSSLLICSSEVHAYVGPGVGLGAIGVFLGTVVGILLAIIGIFWYPFKRLIKKFKSRKQPKQDNEE